MKKQEKPQWKPPVILYEEPEYPGAPANPIPYLETDKDNPMPPLIFIEEVYDTGEMEVGEKGVPQKICDYIMHQYLDMELAKKKLGPVAFDELRVALGMKPLAESAKLGEEILKKVEAKMDVISQAAQDGQAERMKKAKKFYEEKKKKN